MRLVFGSGKYRRSFVLPTGSKIGVTQEHVNDMCALLKNNGVVFRSVVIPTCAAPDEKPAEVLAA